MKPERMLDHYLRQLAPQIPAKLVNEKSFYDIFRIAELLPGLQVLSTFGFECPLDNATANADFLASFQKKNNGPALLKRTAEKNLTKSKVWDDVAQLANYWTQRQWINDFWLEFDIQGNAPDVPSLFFRPLYDNLSELDNILGISLNNLTGSDYTAQLKALILRLAALLPERAKIFQIGAMRSRPVKGVRLCIHEISLDAILTFLEKTSWPGSIAELKDVLIFLQPLTQNVAFSIDLSENIGAKIGLECYPDLRASANERQTAWVRMLDKLVQKGMVNTGKANVLKTFDACTGSEKLFDELPEELVLAKALMERYSSSMIWQYLHHTKVAYNPGQPLQTKAYLAVQHVWR